MKKKINAIMYSYHTVLISLIILSLVSIFYCNSVMNSCKTYIFEGKDDYVEIDGGVVALNYNVDLFEGSNINYLEKDKTVVSFDIGYYVVIDDEYVPIASIAGEDENGLSLKSLIEGDGVFKVAEFVKNKIYLTDDKLNKLEDGLYFVIKAVDNKNNEISDVLRLDVARLSR